MAQLSKLFDRLLTVLSYVAGILLAVLMLGISYDVVMRYFFNRPTAWAFDISNFIMLSVTLLAAATTLREGGHVSVDLVISLLRPRTRIILNCVTSCIGVIACGLFAWKGVEATWASYQHKYPLIGGITVPEYAVLWVIPFGMSLLCLQFARRARRNLLDLRGTSPARRA